MTTVSPRRAVADRLAAIICEHRLTAPFGGDVNQSQDKRHYAILFAVPRYLDGLVQVFSPKFIRISCQGPLVHGDHSGIYESEAAAAKFLHHIGRTEINEALEIPTRPRRIT